MTSSGTRSAPGTPPVVMLEAGDALAALGASGAALSECSALRDARPQPAAMSADTASAIRNRDVNGDRMRRDDSASQRDGVCSTPAQLNECAQTMRVHTAGARFTSLG